MSKIALISDIHAGAKGDSNWYLRYQLDYIENIIFPEIKKRNIEYIIQLGDFWNSRKSLNINTYHWVKKRLLDKSRYLGLKWIILLGNHDIYYTSTSDVNSLSILKEYDNIEVVSKPKMFNLYGVDFSVVPWISNNDEKKRMINFYENNPHDITFGHFPINNFDVIPGYKFNEGLSKSLFEKFQYVFSGHFHFRQIRDNIIYLGTPYELTWHDYNSKKGWAILDLHNKKYIFIDNNHKLHHKIFYDENKDMISEANNVKDKIINIYIVNKKNDGKFSSFIYELEQNNPRSFTIIEQENINDEFIFSDGNKNIIDIVDDYLNEIDENDKKVYSLMKRLYNEVIIE